MNYSQLNPWKCDTPIFNKKAFVQISLDELLKDQVTKFSSINSISKAFIKTIISDGVPREIGRIDIDFPFVTQKSGKLYILTRRNTKCKKLSFNHCPGDCMWGNENGDCDFNTGKCICKDPFLGPTCKGQIISE